MQTHKNWIQKRKGFFDQPPAPILQTKVTEFHNGLHLILSIHLSILRKKLEGYFNERGIEVNGIWLSMVYILNHLDAFMLDFWVTPINEIGLCFSLPFFIKSQGEIQRLMQSYLSHSEDHCPTGDSLCFSTWTLLALLSPFRFCDYSHPIVS